MATLDDPMRFQKGAQVADYLGLTPRVYQSGDVDYRGRITKEGDGLLRWHLVEAANVLLTRGKDCALRRWGKRLEERKGGAKARVAVARKLAVLLWRLWITGESFRPWPRDSQVKRAVA
jgi:transposase